MALGASILERHFTDDMSREGPDIVCSMDPSALKELIEGSIAIFKAKGNQKKLIDGEKGVFDFANSSIVSIKEIKEGDIFSKENLWLKRPGNGDFHAEHYSLLLGKKSKNCIPEDAQIKKSDIDWE